MPSEANIERFRDATLRLLPPGDAVDTDPDSDLGKLVEALSVEPARVYEKQEALITESLPSDATEDGLLASWESIFGLPGDCSALASTEEGRQAAVKAKLRGRAGHAASVFESVAQSLGYDSIEVTYYDEADWFGAGSFAGDYVTGDSFAFVVKITVNASDGPDVDDQLVCLFDEIRRAHGFLDITVEGPMGAIRTASTIYDQKTLGATVDSGADGNIGGLALSEVSSVAVQYGGTVSIQVRMDDGTGTVDGPGSSPTSSPNGSWKLYAQSGIDDIFSPVDEADTALAELDFDGTNTVVDRTISITDFPGTAAKLLYVRTSGGGGDEVCSVGLSAW